MARAFYDEEIPAKGHNRSKSDKSDNRGIAVVILDALTRCVILQYYISAASLHSQFHTAVQVLERSVGCPDVCFRVSLFVF